MSDCKHKLRFTWLETTGNWEDLFVDCVDCCETLDKEMLKDYTIISKADLEEIKGLYCPKASGLDGLETFPNCGKCVVCRAKQGDL